MGGTLVKGKTKKNKQGKEVKRLFSVVIINNFLDSPRYCNATCLFNAKSPRVVHE